jgi:hypothetical protein
VFIEPRAYRLAGGVEIDGFQFAVPHRLPPGTAPAPTADSAAHSMADASSLSRTDLWIQFTGRALSWNSDNWEHAGVSRSMIVLPARWRCEGTRNGRK